MFQKLVLTVSRRVLRAGACPSMIENCVHDKRRGLPQHDVSKTSIDCQPTSVACRGMPLAIDYHRGTHIPQESEVLAKSLTGIKRPWRNSIHLRHMRRLSCRCPSFPEAFKNTVVHILPSPAPAHCSRTIPYTDYFSSSPFAPPAISARAAARRSCRVESALSFL